MERSIKTARVADIIFDRSGDAFVRTVEVNPETGSRDLFPCKPDVAVQLRALPASGLAMILGNVAKIVDRYVVSFIAEPRELEQVGAAGAGDRESWQVEQQDTDETDAPAPRVVLERYGVAVSMDKWIEENGVTVPELYVYPITKSGAISPIGTRVTRPSPEFLSDVNALMMTGGQTQLTLDHFPGAIVPDRATTARKR
jgi:hypothetical protein